MKKLLYCLLASALMLSACKNTPTTEKTKVTDADLQGSWLIEYINQQPVIDRSPASLSFNKDGKVTGNSSCNRFMTGYQFNQTAEDTFSTLTFSQSAGTMMMCSETLMNQEQRFFSALAKVTHVTIENGLLMLTDNNQQVILKASKQE